MKIMVVCYFDGVLVHEKFLLVLNVGVLLGMVVLFDLIEAEDIINVVYEYSR